MSGFQPVALFGLEVPPGEMLIPAASRFPASVSLAPESQRQQSAAIASLNF